MGQGREKAVLLPVDLKALPDVKSVNSLAAFSVIRTPAIGEADSEQLHKMIIELLQQESSLGQAILVLPESWRNSNTVDRWPPLLYKHSKGILLLAIAFEGDLPRWKKFPTNTDETKTCNVSCQYEAPYTDLLESWSRAGATTFHPGDYYRDEMLFQLKNMKGTWFYFGHASSRELYAYPKFNGRVLTTHIPENPLDLVAWFSCSTLQKSARENLALSYYNSGATHCLMAAIDKAPTADNAMLVRELLAEFKKPDQRSLATALLAIARRSDFLMDFINRYYRILGNPAGKIFLPNSAVRSASFGHKSYIKQSSNLNPSL